MNLNESISLSSLSNVVTVLDAGGVWSCSMIAARLWEEASEEKREAKVNAARNSANRTVQYATRQLRQEVRRSIHAHFLNPDESGMFISRCVPVGGVEHFWVEEVQSVITTDVDEILEEEDEILVHPDSIIGRLASVSSEPGVSLSEALSNADITEVDNAVNINIPDISDNLRDVLNEVLAEELSTIPATPTGRLQLDDTLHGLVQDLIEVGL